MIHFYSVPVLEGFDVERNCSNRRRYAKGVDDLLGATGGRPATLYELVGGSFAYFAPEAPDFQEAGELKGDALAKAVRILNGSGVPGGNPVQLEWNRLIQAIFKRVIMVRSRLRIHSLST